MAVNKIDYKNTFFQLSMGLIVYFLFIKQTIKADKKPNLIVGELEGLGLDYQAEFFQDKEYFKSFAIPENYLNNWNKLKYVLDTIRKKYGSAIVISRGYSPSETGLITDTFQTCQSAEIYPQNGNVKLLKKIISDLVVTGQIMVLENIFTSNSKFKITVNG